VNQEPRKAALAALTMIANDEEEGTDARIAAASVILDATHPVPSQREQDNALRDLGDQVARRVIELLGDRPAS
jgi:hypothetical protein